MRRVASALSVVVLGLSIATFGGCLCGPGGLDGLDDGLDGGGLGSGGGGNGPDGGGLFGSYDPISGRDAGCASVKSAAALGSKPVDVIFVIDNSGSMTAEITGVENNINANFANIMADAGLDYRVIMLSRHGSATGNQSICVQNPLSGTNCSPIPAQPAATNQFKQYSVEIGSTNSLRLILSTFDGVTAGDNYNPVGGWKDWLRAGSFKTFVEITDDNETGITALNFDTQLLAKSPTQFGTSSARNYIFHSIIGVPAKTNAAEAYLPTEQVPAGNCSSAVNAGSTYHGVSQLTGGLRFPVCDPNLYNTVFQKVAEGVVAGARVACDFNIPAAPAGYQIANKIFVDYYPNGTGTVQTFIPVADAASCNGDTYYTSGGQVHLCPTACAKVKGDTTAKLDVIFTCEAGSGGIN